MFTQGETEISFFSEDGGKIKIRNCQSLSWSKTLPSICHLPDYSQFSLVTTFNKVFFRGEHH